MNMFYQDWKALILFTLVWIDLKIVSGQSVVPATSSGPSDSTFKNDITWPGYFLAAFVDLNADRQMDIVLVSNDGKQLFAVIAPDTTSMWNFHRATEAERHLPDPTLLLDPGLPLAIRSVTAADFNGDSIADLLILTGAAQYGPVTAYIAFGQNNTDGDRFDLPTELDKFISQPLVCDLNSDMIADIYGQRSATLRVIHYGGSPLRTENVAYSGLPWSPLGYSAFGDVMDDSTPEIIILVEEKSTRKLQLIRSSMSTISAPPDTSKVILIDLPQQLLSTNELTLGLFLLADFNGDGNIELLLSACTSKTCTEKSELSIYDFAKEKWFDVGVIWTPKGLVNDYVWSLTPSPSMSSTGLATSALAGSALGDLDLDGLPDLGIVLSYSSNGRQVGQMPAVLLNRGQREDGQFSMQAYLLPGSTLPEDNKQLSQVAFFDHHEKGSLDVFVTSLDKSGLPSVQLFLQQMTNDHYFIKVTVLNGLCRSQFSCSNERLPYGLPVPGILTAMSTESFSGTRQLSSALLGGQSCCAALQLPSTTYGLGPFANYVDKLTVTIPPHDQVIRSHVISVLFPKSEVFVNPFPPDSPNRWQTKLFLQPLYNMEVVYVAITLFCICLLIIVIIIILHCLELREDRSEKQKEAQRFHFDAM